MPYRNAPLPVAERLRRTVDHLDAAQRLAHLGSWQAELGEETQIHWSPEARHIAGWKADEPEPTVDEFIGMVHPEDREGFEEMRSAALADRRPYAIDCRFVRRDGDVRHLHLDADIQRDESGKPVHMVGIVQDVTEIVELFRQLAAGDEARRQLLRRLIRSAETERSILARSLHDGPIQELSAVALRLEHVATTNDSGPVLDDLAVAVQRVIDSLRSLLFDLHPVPFGRDGMTLTIEHIAARSSPDVDVSVSDDIDEKLDEELTGTIVRIVQEALQNVEKHSRASLADVTLRSTETEVRLDITDNGEGFDPVRATEPGHLGLVAMRERAEAVGGSLTVESAAGRTTVRARLPLP